MRTIKDLTGQQFGYLKALKVHTKTSNNHAIWLCKCSFCDSETYVVGNNLISGNTKRCSKCSNRQFSLSEAALIYRDREEKMMYKHLAEKYDGTYDTIKSAIKLYKDYIKQGNTNENNSPKRK